MFLFMGVGGGVRGGYLSQRLKMGDCVYLPSVGHFFEGPQSPPPETPGPIFFKFPVEPSVRGEMENLYKWSPFIN